MVEFQHYTVMKKETVDGLNIKPDGIYVDCTLGGAGHSEYILKQLNEQGHLYAFDQDQKAIDFANERLVSYVEKGQVTFIKRNFRYLKEELNQLGVTIMMITHDMHLMLEYTTRALVINQGKLLADAEPVAVLTNAELVEAASLKETSLFSFAKQLQLADPFLFTENFVAYDREVRFK